MKIRDEYTFNAVTAGVWDQIFTTGALGWTMPGGRRLAETAPGEYKAVFPVNMLLFKSDLFVEIKILEQKKPAFCRFSGQGVSEIGAIYLTGNFWLEETEGKTRLTYEAEPEFEGSLGNLARRALERSGRDRIRQGLREMEDRMKS